MSLKLSTSDDAKSHWSWCVCVAAWSQRAGRQAKEFAPVIVLVIQLLPGVELRPPYILVHAQFGHNITTFFGWRHGSTWKCYAKLLFKMHGITILNQIFHLHILSLSWSKSPWQSKDKVEKRTKLDSLFDPWSSCTSVCFTWEAGKFQSLVLTGCMPRNPKKKADK